MVLRFVALSPRMLQLQCALEAGDGTALERFWQEISERGGPLLEPSPRNEEEMLVTFLWRGQARNVTLIGGPAVLGDLRESQLSHLSGTDLWYKTYQLPADLRITYQFLPDDPLIPCREMCDILEKMSLARADPLNPRSMNAPLGLPGKHSFMHVSILELPRMVAQTWSLARPDVPRGTVSMHMFESLWLKKRYHITIYTPPGYAQAEAPAGLLLLFDGLLYMNYMALPTIMDNLLHSGKILPSIVVLLSHLDESARRTELLCHAPFLDFLLKELWPWIHERYRVTDDPRRTIVGGVSAGGVAAAFAALCAPEVFGNVLSQSGTYWSSGGVEGEREAEWLTRQYQRQPRLAVRFALEIGVFERYTLVDPLAATRRLREALVAKGYAVDYSEFHGGHDLICWRETFPDRLLALVGRGRER